MRLVGECKWNQRQLLSSQVLTDLRQFKLPALRQVGLDVDSARIALFSRAGFSRDLREAAEKDPSVELIGPDELVRPAA